LGLGSWVLGLSLLSIQYDLELLRIDNIMIRTISTFKVLFYVTVILGTLLNVAQVLKLRSNAGRIKQDNVQVSSLGHTEANKADFHIEQFSVFSQFSGEKIINSTHLSIISQSSEEESIQVDLVKPDDIIYSSGWDSAPIVLDEYKLVFFTIPKAGCTIWKQLFRRMMGFKNWQKQSQANDVKELPHNPKFNGLTYLHHYSLEEASQIMTSREWTRAIFVRDPKERFLSAFLDKALSNGGVHVQKKCCPNGECKKDAQTFPGFINLVFKGGCKNPHWNPQNNRMENKYWKVRLDILVLQKAIHSF